MRTTMSKKIKLLQIKEGKGYGAEPETLAERTVWASIGDIGASTKLNAASIGVKIDLRAYCWRKEFEKAAYTHVEYQGVRYKIAETGSGDTDLKVRLLLTRG